MFGKIITAMSAAVFLLLGVWYFSTPDWPMSYVDLPLPGPTARIEIGTFYGGLEIALGIVFLWFLINPLLFVPGLMIQAILYLGCVCARVAGILRYDGESNMIYYILASEIFGFVMAFSAWWVESKRRPDLR